MKRKDRVYEFLRRMKSQKESKNEYTATEIATAIGSSRANVSSDLNRLLEEGLVERGLGRPVRYSACATVITSMPIYSEIDSSSNIKKSEQIFKDFIGYDGSLRTEVEKAKAGVIYPPHGLPMLIVGETGVGKSMFARLLFEYAREMGCLKEEAKFVAFNCADYASNPQLLLSQLFGHTKGAFTGADRERAGLVEKADGGILFLDEVHRLPPEAQEMLFTVMDYGKFRRLGEAEQEHYSRPLIILATTDIQNQSLLATFKRRIPIDIMIPALSERNVYERLKLVEAICRAESTSIMVPIKVDAMVMKALIAYDCPGNIGQLKNDIKVICARAYVQTIRSRSRELHITVQDLPPHVKLGLGNIGRVYSEINLIVSNFMYWPEGGKQEKEWDRNWIYDYISEQLNTVAQDGGYPDIEDGLMAAIELFCFDFHKKNQWKEWDPQAMLNAEIIRLVNDCTRLIRQKMAIEVTPEKQKTLALLIGTMLQRLERRRDIICPFLPWIRKEAPDQFRLAREIIEKIGPECGEEDKANSAGFMAGFLYEIEKRGHTEENTCRIFVIGCGQGSAQSMAKVSNEILGKEFVGWYDIINDKITPEEEKTITDTVQAHFGGQGGILFYKDKENRGLIRKVLKHLEDKGVYMVGDTKTQTVIEASIEAYELHNSPSSILERLKGLSHGEKQRMEEKEKPDGFQESKSGKGVIVTACVSGCGVALKIKQLIEKKYVLCPETTILSMDIFSVTEFKNRIAAVQEQNEILCIIGLDIGMDLGIPYIAAHDFILGRGEEYFLSLIRSCNIQIQPRREMEIGKSEYEETLIKKEYFSSFLHYLNGETLVPYVDDVLDELELVWGKLELGKRIVLLVHICCMVERLLFTEPVEEKREVRMASGQKEIYEKAMGKLSEIYHLHIPDQEYEMIEKIINVDFNE